LGAQVVDPVVFLFPENLLRLLNLVIVVGFDAFFETAAGGE
jgi:hypothetical protein